MSKKLMFSFLIIFAIGVAIGFYIEENLPGDIIPSVDKEVRLSGYKYISPLLECDTSQQIGTTEYKPSIAKIRNFLADATNNKSITYASVYYRDLNNGPWFGINEKELFTPASLLKLPVMIAYYKQAESDPSILKNEIKYNADINELTPTFAPAEKLTKGATYTVEDLIKRMITYSDNEALYLLTQNIKADLISKVTNDLGIETPKGDDPNQNYISVKNYASLFRVLFNASYLNKSDSEKALKLLSDIQFKDGLNIGVPKEITIAHKFGERELPDGTKQLHDCGIVYFPKHPYLLCVMTRGTDYKNLSKTIGQISKNIYEDLDKKF